MTDVLRRLLMESSSEDDDDNLAAGDEQKVEDMLRTTLMEDFSDDDDDNLGADDEQQDEDELTAALANGLDAPTTSSVLEPEPKKQRRPPLDWRSILMSREFLHLVIDVKHLERILASGLVDRAAQAALISDPAVAALIASLEEQGGGFKITPKDKLLQDSAINHRSGSKSNVHGYSMFLQLRCCYLKNHQGHSACPMCLRLYYHAGRKEVDVFLARTHVHSDLRTIIRAYAGTGGLAPPIKLALQSHILAPHWTLVKVCGTSPAA